MTRPHSANATRRRPLGCVVARLFVLTTIVWFLASCASSRDTIRLEINGHTLNVELAISESQQARGLMYRKSLPSDGGMLFVYKRPQQLSYWMKNTFVPLSIAYIDSHKRIINMHDMAPSNSTRTYPSRGPGKYALEVNQGWFEVHGVEEGDRVAFEIPPERMK